MRATPVALGSLVVTLGVLTACSSPGGGPVPTTITVEQARQTAEDYTRPVTTVLPGTSLDPVNIYGNDVPCAEIDDGQPPGRIQVSRDYFVRGLDPGNAIADVATLDRYLTSRGFQPLEGQKPRPDLREYRNPTDGYNASVIVRDDGLVSIGVSSPCVWPTGRAPNA